MFFHPFSDNKIRIFLRAIHVFFGSRFHSAVLFSQVPKKCTDLDLSVLCNLISETYSKFARKKYFLSLCADVRSAPADSAVTLEVL